MWVEVTLGVILLLLLWQVLKKPSDLPPGRWGLPLVGWLPLSFKKSFQEHLADLHKQHGDVYIWRVGSQIMVFLHDYRMTRDAFASNDFADRPDFVIFNFNEKPPKGIVGSNGLLWQNNRRFTLKQLRDLGMGKSRLVAAVHTQAEMLIEEFKKVAGRPTKVPHAIDVAIVNIIWQMIGSIQFKPTDAKLKEFDDLVQGAMSSFYYLAILDFFPWITKVLPDFLVNKLTRKNMIKNIFATFSSYFKEVIDDHKAVLDRNNPRDLIDSYLVAMEEDDPDLTCSETDLVFVLFDLFNAGSQTTRTMLTWVIFYLASYPEVQKKMQKEIDEVLQRGTLPTLEDKPRLPYSEAVIHETHRYSRMVTLEPQHVATRDTQLGGYNIPKGSIITACLFGMHADVRYWDKPEEFRPERWLNKEGKFVSKKEGFLPFGTGKRQCVGEGLARLELFIFATTLFQNFSIAPPPGKKLDLRPKPGNPLIYEPRFSQELLVTVRQ